MRQQEPDINEIAFRIVQAATTEEPAEEPKPGERTDEQAPVVRPTIKERPGSAGHDQGRLAAG